MVKTGGVYLWSNGNIIRNSIIYNNSSPNWGSNGDGTIENSCTTPEFSGNNNIIIEPMFVNVSADNYHLQTMSPCINAGTNMNWMIGAIDLDGGPRIYDDNVDMGCYEFGSTSSFKNIYHN